MNSYEQTEEVHDDKLAKILYKQYKAPFTSEFWRNSMLSISDELTGELVQNLVEELLGDFYE